MTKIRKKIGTIPINDIEQQVQQSTQAAVTQMQQDVQDFINEETAQYPEIGGAFKFQEDPEGRSEITTDAEGKILSYRKPNGTLVEKVGLDTPAINGTPTNELNIKNIVPREYNLPKYGNVDIQKELSFTDGENSYNPNKVSKIDGKYYVTSTLVDGQVVPGTSIEVSLVESDIDITSWPADKSTKHYCKVKINFAGYLEGTYYIEVKFQGDSTLAYPKKNFRFTFYKDITFSKKMKIKIGEFIEASKYNLKAYWFDKALLREPSCYRIIQAIRETRDYNKQYPWNKNYAIFTGATGLTVNFPTRIDVSGEFYGINWFGLAKDINNFMLDDETMNGILVQADAGNEANDFWHVFHEEMWNDILADTDNELAPETLPSFQDFYTFINSGSGFNKETAPLHMDIDDWIDCIIIFELFRCNDSMAKNFMLYTDSDKQVYHPMYYDLDYTWTMNPIKGSVLSYAMAKDTSLFVNFINLYWNEICERYKELRRSVITKEYICTLVQNMLRNISYQDFEKELTKWDEHGSGTLASNLNWIKSRIDWLDSYFIKNN